MVDLRNAVEMKMQMERERRILSRGFKQPTANDKQVAGTHYKDMGVQVWDVVDSWPLEQRIGYYRGNALKYVMRCGNKDEATQELKKAIHYLEKLVEILEDKNG